MSTASSTPFAIQRHPRTVTISQVKLREVLASIRGSTFVGFTAFTTPEGRKAPFGPIRKLCKVSALTGGLYERAAAKAGHEASEERAWGEHDQSALVTKVHPETGVTSYYLPTQNPKPGRPLYLAPNGRGRLAVVPTDQVTPFLRVRPEPPVVKKDYRLDHITQINVLGRRYRVRPEPVAASV